MASATQILEHHQALSDRFGSEPLLVHPDGRIIDLATGYIPLLSTFTTEDKAAKGLRKGKETLTEPEYFYLLELVRDNQILLLNGPAGSGKTTFAKHLCYTVAGQNHAARNTFDSIAAIESRNYNYTGLQPCYFDIGGLEDLEELAHNTIPTLLADPLASNPAGLVIVIDAIENAGPNSAGNIDSIAAQFLASSNKRHRLVFLGDTSAFCDLTVPLAITRYNIRPLSLVQRRYGVSKSTHMNPKLIEYALGDAASNPALFALALQAEHQGDKAEALLDAWLEAVVSTGISTANVEQNAFHQVCLEIRHSPALEGEHVYLSSKSPLLARSREVKRLLAARYLYGLSADVVVRLYRHNPILAADIIQSLLIRLQQGSSEKFDDLAEALLQEKDTTSQRAALLIAKVGGISARLEHQINLVALAIIEQGQLPIAERQDAASVLSRLGDPRDLTTLIDIPASTVTLGSNTHPNSQPTHNLHIESFRIAAFPVTIQQYAAFTTATDRPWASPDKHDNSKQNFPATDLTYHDAVAYCAWLTTLWRANGTISEDEQVRLPSEPEWEKAASAELNNPDLPDCLYPWGTSWQPDASNSEETGLNQPCAVGLFPKARSVYGCHDMAGNIWEWCSTLWGKDMAAPSYRYPWRDDGREALEAAPELRRVLRGGCFSSGRLKANCTYRGSLEPCGYWRGNGFRVVVAVHGL
jgi:iron(II)-dependent oxidoreductase